MEIGYARVSTGEQTLDLQLDALTKAGCGKIYQETASGAKADRPVLDEVLSYLRKGDTLVVWRLDRLGRSLEHLIETVAALAERGIGFKCLTEQIDTTTPGGKLIFHVFGALAEFERDLIRERTQAGLAGHAPGDDSGRPKKLTDAKQLDLARTLYDGGRPTSRRSASLLGSLARRSIGTSSNTRWTLRRRPSGRATIAPFLRLPGSPRCSVPRSPVASTSRSPSPSTISLPGPTSTGIWS